MCAVVLGVLWKGVGLPLELAIFLSLVVGGLAGLLNGLFIVRVGVPPLIMTLATPRALPGDCPGHQSGA